MRPYQSNADLLGTVEERGHDYRVLGYAPGGEPIVSIRGRGEETPGIVLTSGSHAGEHAGVAAAVELVDALETDREVHVVPTRDPVGLNGYESVLGDALGRDVDLDSFRTATELLRNEGDVVRDGGDLTLALVGDIGFATQADPDLPADSHAIAQAEVNALETEAPGVLDAFKGRRVYLAPGLPDVEGTRTFDRAHTLIIDPDGLVRHLNRFFDSTWAPPETRAVRKLLAETEPGLFVDLHEAGSSADRFWFTLRRKDDPALERREEEIGRTVVRAIDESGGRLAGPEHRFGGGPMGDQFFTPVEDGLFWLEHAERDSVKKAPSGGLNATDYAAEEYGLSFTNETGVHGSFERRVEQAILAVRTAVDDWVESGNQ